MADSWSSMPLVFVPVITPRCPSCGHTGFVRLRSSSGGDGSVSRRCICRQCGSRCVIVLERSAPSGQDSHDDC